MKKPILFYIIIVTISIFRVWLIKDREIVAITPTPHDAQLYITNALSVANNQWFGPYNERILARGPTFPLFIAAAYHLHIPLGIANTVFYILTSLLFVTIAFHLSTIKWILIPLYVLLLFNPFTFDHETSFEITRSTFYPALILGVVLNCMGLFLTVHTSFKQSLLFSILLGCIFFLFWFHREEGFFILPIIGISYGYSLFHAWAHKKISKTYMLALSVPILIFVLLTHILCFINYKHYGTYTARQFSHKSYTSAFFSLLRIYEDSGNPLIPVTKNQRMILYQVSPMFAKLQPFFEGEGGENLAQSSAVWTGIPKEEREIAGGSFYFGIRSAVWSITQPSQSAEQKFFEQLTQEINQACRQKYVSCGILPLSGFSLLNQKDRVSLFDNFVNTVQTGALANKIDINTDAKYSDGPKDQIEIFRKMTNGIILTKGQQPPKQNRITKNTYRIISWWYQSVMPWIFLLTMLHYFFRILRNNVLQFYDWYQGSLLLSTVLFYIVVAIFGTLKSPSNTTAGSYTGAVYVLLILFSILEIVHLTKKSTSSP